MSAHELSIQNAPVTARQRRGRWRGRFARSVGVLLAAALCASAFAQAPAFADPSVPFTKPKRQPLESVPVKSVNGAERQADPEAEAAWKRSPKVTWPAAKSVNAAVPERDSAAERQNWERVGDLPIRVAPAAHRGPDVESGRPQEPSPGRVTVEVASREAAKASGVDGLMLRLRRADGVSAPGAVKISVGYSDFRHAYGGDWASRLRLVELPACALTTPERAECHEARVVRSHNNGQARTVTGEVGVDSTSDTVYALAAGSSGSGGNHGATSLAPSGSWSAGGSSGGFSWSQPLRMPPSMGGPAPSIALGYSSQSVDGRTAYTNNQPSWIGEGWDYQPGFIERKYVPCSKDTEGAGNPKTGDLCWKSNNVTMSLNGASTELVRDDTTAEYRPANDDGSKIAHLYDAGNGDNSGEHWRVTTTDGTRYYFGRHKLPGWASGDSVTNSTWTVPVFGNHSGEPCHGSSFAASSCQQAWRWNLDYVVDPHGNSMAYYYSKQDNRYGRNLKADDAVVYQRGGWLSRIDYGMRSGSELSTLAPMRVSFGVADRCIPGTTCTKSNPENWPDVPWDQECAAAPCTGNYSPSFWITKRLSTITTKVRAGSDYRSVDTWTLRHSIPVEQGDEYSAALWLDGIQQSGGTLKLPEVTFDGTLLDNRVDKGTSDGLPALSKRRIEHVYNDTGGVINVYYSGPQCLWGSNMPASKDTNTKRCYPQQWTPEGGTEPIDDWFHKYVVTEVAEHDNTGASPTQRTYYEYLDGGAWAHEDSEFVPQEDRTWSQWRGYERVEVRSGISDETQSLTEYRYFRGMHGDKLAAGGTKSETVKASDGTTTTDHRHLQGTQLEEITYDGGAVVGGSVNEPRLLGPTAKRAREGTTTLRAYVMKIETVRDRAALASGGLRRTAVTSAFDQYGIATSVHDQGDPDDPQDDKCTRFEYARNETKWMMSSPSLVQTAVGTCEADSPAPADILSSVKIYYDESDVFGDLPGRGLATRVDELSEWDAGRPVYVNVSRTGYDSYGRVVSSTDALGKTTATTYTPATGGPLTQVATTNPLQHTSTTILDPAWGAATATVDANGNRTDLEYDELGRLTKAWLPGRIKGTHSPNSEHAYQVRANAPTVITTKGLRIDGNYNSTYELYDGWMRPRQTQLPTDGGGRMIADTLYDSRGLVDLERAAYYNSGLPGNDLVQPTVSVPASTDHVYDGAARSIADIFQVNGTERWRTTTSYDGDRVHVDPPDGAAASTSITNARGQVVELRQYKGGSPTGEYDSLFYSYTALGQMKSVKDSAGNEWSFTYDLRGRKTSSVDPDSGTTTFTYDQASQLKTTTDNRQQTVAYTYDDIGRRTGMHAGSTALAKWTYDTVAKGLPTASTRYVDGQAYTKEVTRYDPQGRPLDLKVTIPASEGALAGTYPYHLRYYADGSPSTLRMPGGGGLTAETLRFAYNEFGAAISLKGAQTYVDEAMYTQYGELDNLLLGNSTDGYVAQTWIYEQGTRRLKENIVYRQASAGLVLDTYYKYDDAGNVTRIADLPADAPQEVECFSYDHRQRLTKAWTPQSTADDSCAGGPVESELGGPAPYWTSYGYDDLGNRASETRHEGPGQVQRTYDYTLDGTSQVHRLRSVLQKDTTGGAEITTQHNYAYDESGSLKSRTIGDNAQTFNWDVEGRLSRVTDGAGETSFLYDAEGNRLIRRDPGSVTLYLDGMELKLNKTTGSVSGTRFYSFAGRTVAVRSVTGVSWLASDHHGTASLALDASTLEVTRRRFDPFGKPRGEFPSSWPDEKGFVGGTRDASTGLTHLGAREYDPDTGRFISVDPVIDFSDSQQMHGYSYANNSPVTFSDPDGLYLVGNDSGTERATPAYGGGYNVYDGSGGAPVRVGGGGGGGGGSSTSAYEAAKAKADALEKQARQMQNVSLVDVALEAGGEILMEVLGINDIRNCVSKGAVGACVSMVVGFFPWGKILKAGKVVQGLYKAYKAVKNVLKMRERAKTMLRTAKAMREAAKAGLAKAAKTAADAGGKAGGKVKEAAEAIGRKVGGGRKAGGRGGCNSFTPGTKVVMADGSTKRIKDVKLGDKVLATDPKTGRTVPREVTALIKGEGFKHLVKITVKPGDKSDSKRAGKGDTITATDGHPFWVENLRMWVDARDLLPGALLRTSAGTYVQVTAVEHSLAVRTVHNLTVADIHTYYAAAGQANVLTHNCGPDDEGPGLRQRYVAEVNGLKKLGGTLLSNGASPELTARVLHAQRRIIGEHYKALTSPDMLERIYRRNIDKYGDKLGPTIPYLRGRGKSWEDIIESASRTGGRDLGL